VLSLVIACWALAWATRSRMAQAMKKFGISAGHALARNNLSAQPLPS
jgi:hypothetical protein